MHRLPSDWAPFQLLYIRLIHSRTISWTIPFEKSFKVNKNQPTTPFHQSLIKNFIKQELNCYNLQILLYIMSQYFYPSTQLEAMHSYFLNKICNKYSIVKISLISDFYKLKKTDTKRQFQQGFATCHSHPYDPHTEDRPSIF